VTGRPASGQVAALQAALAAENAAIYGYGVAGAYLDGARQATATAYWNDHRSAADALAGLLRARGAQPAAADAAYRLPFAVRTAQEAAALAVFLEDGVTTGYLALVAEGDATLRRLGALAMQDCAVRATYWRGDSVPFPGLPASAAGGARSRHMALPARPHTASITARAQPGAGNGVTRGAGSTARGGAVTNGDSVASGQLPGLLVWREDPGDPAGHAVEVLAHPDPLGPRPPEPPGAVLAAPRVDVLGERGGIRVDHVQAGDPALRGHEPGAHPKPGQCLGQTLEVSASLLLGGLAA
jgi:Domain of unknown function (DUF4439)